MTEQTNPSIDPNNRCRLVLLLDGERALKISADQMSDILSAGDVASIVFSAGSVDDAEWQNAIDPLVKAAQAAGVAAIIAENSRIAGRVGADGMQLGQDPDAIREAIGKFSPKFMVGAANVKTRHTALVIGELQPDYVIFGKPGNDTRAEPHPKNIDLGAWWSAMVEIPCIVLGGNSIESALDVAKCGADFVALGTAIFAPQGSAKELNTVDAAARVRQTNELLDTHAPPFETSDA